MVEQLKPQLSELERHKERGVFIRSVPRRASQIKNDPEFLQYTRDHIKEFKHRVSNGAYSESERNLIFDALDLAIVAYQDNDNHSLRQRRRTVQYGGEDVHIPYIDHPLSVAMAMIGVPRRIRMADSELSDETIDIDVRQDPYKAEVIAAALLHDVFEDSQIKLSLGTVIKGDTSWPAILREYFIDVAPESLNSVITLIQAVTKYSDISEGLLRVIGESEVFNTITMLVEERNAPSEKKFEKIEGEVGRSLSDLHKIIETCFGVGGDLHFDEQSCQNFLGALAIKCHDVENNLEDSKVREDKLVRAHILAAFARLYGLPVASRMAAYLIVNNHFDMFWGIGDRERNLREGIETVRLYGEFESTHHRPVFKVAGEQLKVDALQIPILTAGEIIPADSDNVDDFRSVLQYRMTVNDPEVLKKIREKYAKADEYNPIKISYGRDNFVGYPVREHVQDEISATGRECYYLKVYKINGGNGTQARSRLAGIYRIQDDQPSAHDVLKLDSIIKAQTVPELHLISDRYNGDPESSMEIFSLVCDPIQSAI